MEKESLERRQQLALEEMKLAMEEARQKEMSELEQEKEQFLSELRERLDREKRKVRSVLPDSAEVWGLNHACSALVTVKHKGEMPAGLLEARGAGEENSPSCFYNSDSLTVISMATLHLKTR